MRITHPRLARVWHTFDAFKLARLLNDLAGFAASEDNLGNGNLSLNRFSACFGPDG